MNSINGLKRLISQYAATLLPKNFLCLLIIFYSKCNFGREPIDFIIRVFNWFSPRTKLLYAEAFEAMCNTGGVEVHRLPGILSAAKPQTYYQNHPIEEIRRQDFFVLSLANAKIFGSSNIIESCLGCLLYEPFFADNEKKWIFTDTSILKNNDRRFVLKYRPSNMLIPCGIMLSGNYSWNYYHFVIEFITKLLLINDLSLPKEVPLLVDEYVKNCSNYQEILRYFNSCNRELIYLKSGYRYQVETLYYPSLLNLIPPEFKNINDIIFSDCLFNVKSIDFLRRTLLPKRVTTNSKKRVFLSRRNISSRRSYNERELLEIFEKYDFQIVCPEDYNIAEQVYLFNNADFIVGATGAAFTNILFCKQGCKVLCITNIQNELSIFSTIAKYLELDFQYLAAHEKPHKPIDLHEAFIIDPPRLEQILIDFLTK